MPTDSYGGAIRTRRGGRPGPMPTDSYGGYRDFYDFNPRDYNDPFQNAVNRGFGNTLTVQARNRRKLSQYGTDAAYPLALNLTGFGEQAYPLAYGQLVNILQGQGKTDPRAMNRLIVSSQRDTQTQQGDLQATLARLGLSSSGLGQATGAAIGQAGSSRVAGIQANEAQLAEERKRKDLELFMSMLVGPATDFAALSAGQYNAQAGQKQAKQSAQLNSYASILGAILGAL